MTPRRTRTLIALAAAAPLALTPLAASAALAAAPAPNLADSGTPATGPLLFVPLTPSRVVDTRMFDETLAPGETRTVSVRDAVTGERVVPVGAKSVAYNITVPRPAASGHLRVQPGGSPTLTSASAINFRAGESIANGLTTILSDTGTIDIHNGSAQPVDAIVDVTGYFTPPAVGDGSRTSMYFANDPQRVYSSDDGGSPLAPGASVTVTLPAAFDGATAAAYNLTVVSPSAAGHLRIHPAGTPTPKTSAINFAAGDRIANASIVAVGTPDSPPRPGARAVTVHNGSSAPVRFNLDVTGSFRRELGGAWFHAVAPTRAADTRDTTHTTGVTPGTWDKRTGALGAAETRMFSLSFPMIRDDTTGVLVPDEASAVDYNATVTATATAGHLRLWGAHPDDADADVLPPTSVLNWPGAGYTRANGAITGIGAKGWLGAYNGSAAAADVIVDVNGYYSTS